MAKCMQDIPKLCCLLLLESTRSIQIEISSFDNPVLSLLCYKHLSAAQHIIDEHIVINLSYRVIHKLQNAQKIALYVEVKDRSKRVQNTALLLQRCYVEDLRRSFDSLCKIHFWYSSTLEQRYFQGVARLLSTVYLLNFPKICRTATKHTKPMLMTTTTHCRQEGFRVIWILLYFTSTKRWANGGSLKKIKAE